MAIASSAPDTAQTATKGGVEFRPDPEFTQELGDPPQPADGRRTTFWLSPPWSWLWLALLIALFALSAWQAWRQPPHLNPYRGVSDWDVLKWEWWAYPLERNAPWRTVVQGDLHGIFASPDGQRLWAVGERGLILHSANGGATWTQQAITPPAPPRPAATSSWWSPINNATAAEQDAKGSVVQQSVQQQPVVDESTLRFKRLLDLQQQLKDQQRQVDQQVSQTAQQLSTSQGTAPLIELPTEAERAAAALRDVFFVDAQRGWAVGERGRIVLTTNGGKSWFEVDSETGATLNAVRFAADGRRGWAVGDNSTVLRSDDGGIRWQSLATTRGAQWNALWLNTDAQRIRLAGWGGLAGGAALIAISNDGGAAFTQKSGVAVQPLLCVLFDAQGTRGAALGAGVSLTTADGGGNWQLASGKDAVTTEGVALSGNPLDWSCLAGLGGGLATAEAAAPRVAGEPSTSSVLRKVGATNDQFWVVGLNGRILTSPPGSADWLSLSTRPADAQDTSRAYTRSPAPITIAGMLVALFGFGALAWWGGFRRSAVQAVSAEQAILAASLSADQPLERIADDRLGHAPTVMALSEFIRNAETEPRLTIAVTAPWGRGKSSIMRMLMRDLEDKGFRTAWFNVWHHQQEGRPLSALFNAIRVQALPPNTFARALIRTRLVWRRGWWYRAAVFAALGVASFMAADLVRGTPSWAVFFDRAEWRLSHSVLDSPRVVLSPLSLNALDPYAVKDAPKCDVCSPCAGKAPPNTLRPALVCHMRRAIVWQPDNLNTFCGDRETACVFDSPPALLGAIERSFGPLYPGERALIAKAAEPLPPPTLAPLIEKVVPPLLLLLGLFLTKGISIYGLELLKPLRVLLGGDARAGEGKEVTGMVERYRVEFAHLTEALGGRLVIFIDDLDRCNEATVNAVLELTNYIVDVGKCFVVIGADLKHIKACIKPPAGGAEDREEYASRYLRKLVHIEVPVPNTLEAGVRRVLAEPELPARTALQHTLARWMERLRSTLPTLSMLLALAIVISVSVWFARQREVMHAPIVAAPLATTAATPDSARAPAAPAIATPPDTSAPAATRDVGLQATPVSLPWVSLGLPALAALGVLFVLLLRRSRSLRERVMVSFGAALRTRDSDAFRQALELWHPIVFTQDGTPRGSKRFRNKARFFGTLLAREHSSSQSAETLRVHAVALVALNIACPEMIVQLLHGTTYDKNAEDVLSKVDPHLLQDIGECLAEHKRQWGNLSLESMASFLVHARDIEVR